MTAFSTASKRLNLNNTVQAMHDITTEWEQYCILRSAVTWHSLYQRLEETRHWDYWAINSFICLCVYNQIVKWLYEMGGLAYGKYAIILTPYLQCGVSKEARIMRVEDTRQCWRQKEEASPRHAGHFLTQKKCTAKAVHFFLPQFVL